MQTSQATAFLIEGWEIFNDKANHQCPEFSAIKVARINNCKIFDPIVTMTNGSYFVEIFKGCTEWQQKVRLYLLWDSLQGVAPNPAQYLLKKLREPNLNKIMPEWIQELNEENFCDFTSEVDAQLEKNPFRFVETKEICDELVAISNRLSSEKLIAFLKENPFINTVYGILGKKHLDVTDFLEGTINEEYHKFTGHACKHFKININDRIVNIHLFGGTHGKKDQYDNLIGYIRQYDNLIIPPDNLAVNSSFLLFAKSPLIFLQDQQLLREARRLLDRDYPQIATEKYADIAQFRTQILNTLSKLKGRLLTESERSETQSFIDEFNKFEPASSKRSL